MYSQRRSCSGRCRLAQTSSSIPQPSISTARDAASAASCSASAEFIDETLHNYLKHTGPSLSPFNAWVLLKGLETLSVRVARHDASAAIIADFLADRPEVARVFYPGRADHPQHALAQKQMSGGGPMVAFDLKGDKKTAFRFMNALEVF